MDICVLNPFFYPYKGGTEKVLYEVYSRLSEKHNITVVTSAPKGSKKSYEDRIGNIRIIRLKSNFIYIPKAPLPFVVMTNLDNTLKDIDADLYHINNRFQYFNPTLKVIKSINKKIAITIHNSSPKNIDIPTDKFGFLYDYSWGKKLIHASDLITAVSKDAILSTVPTVDIKRSKVIYNGVDFRLFKYHAKSNPIVRNILNNKYPKGINILNTARLTTQKGQIYILKAVSKLLKENYKVNVIIIGTGPLYNKFIRFAKMHNMLENLRIFNNIPEQYLPYYYNASDIFVFPSLYEPAGLALLEALSSELPVISTKIGGIPEMMKNNGKYIEPSNYEMIYKSLKSIINNGYDRNIIKNARKLMIKEHNWDKISKQYIEQFEKTVKF